MSVTRTLGQFVDRTLIDLQGPMDVGNLLVLTGPMAVGDTTFTLSTGSASVGDVIEFDSELVLVTQVTTDPVPVYTMQRGHFFTTPAAHTSAGYLNQAFPRIKVASAVEESFPRLEAAGIYPIVNESVVLDATNNTLPVSESARQVIGVMDDDYRMVPGWFPLEDVPLSVSPTGKIIRMARQQLDDNYYVSYRSAFRWSSYPNRPTETSTIAMPEGTEDLPSLYALAKSFSNSEISRQELNKVTEWSQGEPSRGGISASYVNQLWRNFYRALDEARRLDPPLPIRPFVRRPRLS